MAQMTDLPLTVGCNCGGVRFEVTEPLVAASYCHCKRCQRRSGAAASPNAHPAPGAFRIVAGEDRLRMWKPRDGGEKFASISRARVRTTFSLLDLDEGDVHVSVVIADTNLSRSAREKAGHIRRGSAFPSAVRTA
jgi:hypothetical protein